MADRWLQCSTDTEHAALGDPCAFIGFSLYLQASVREMHLGNRSTFADVFLAEMCARTVKNELRELLRARHCEQKAEPSEFELRTHVVAFLNLVSGKKKGENICLT